MFVDDTKLFNRICRNDSGNDIANMQHDIDSLILWSNKWQLPFNASKSKFLHLGRSPQTTAALTKYKIRILNKLLRRKIWE